LFHTGDDYGSGPFSVTFPPGVTTAFFYVAITDDHLLEGNEYFILVIDSSSLISGVTAGSLDKATVTIVDNDDDGK